MTVCFSDLNHMRLVKFDGMSPLTGADLKKIAECISSPLPSHIRALVLTGGSSSFSKGANLAWVVRTTRRAEREGATKPLDAVTDRMDGFAEAVAQCGVPVIALCCGDCVGAGAEIACSADVRVCSEDFRFSLPEANFGVIPDIVGLNVIGARVGVNNLMQLCVLGIEWSIKEALSSGLANVVVGDYDEGLDFIISCTSESPSPSGDMVRYIRRVVVGERTGSAQECRKVNNDLISSNAYIKNVVAYLDACGDGL